MQDILKTVVLYAASLAELAAAAVIVSGVIQAMWIYIVRNLCGKCKLHVMSTGRLKLGHALSLALELLIGADILKSSIAPTWEDLGQLATIVAIRTVLNYFLLYEMKKVREEDLYPEGTAH
jgi:uncharacterized membrane protein